MDRATRYDAIVATFVGILALVVSAYTAYVQRQQVRAQVYPIVALTSGWSDNEVHVEVANKGSGPALIRNVIITDGGEALHGWLELTRHATGATDWDGSISISFSSFGRSVLSAGEQTSVLNVTCRASQADEHKAAPPDKSPAPTELLPQAPACARLVTALRRMSLSICYCSTLDDCWTLVDAPGQEAYTKETRRCPAQSDRSFH